MNKIVGISGGSGSGKTYLANKLIEKLGEPKILILAQDNYYKDLIDISYEERTKQNFDHPDAIDFPLLIKHLKRLKVSSHIKMPIYDYTTHTRTGEFKIINSKPIIILDGILIFSQKQILDLLETKIYIDTPSDISIIRRILRDINERGRTLDSVINQYFNSVRPMFQHYVKPTKHIADIVISGKEFDPNILDKIIRDYF